MSIPTFFNALGESLCSSQPLLKLVVLEAPLADEITAIVTSANSRALTLGLITPDDLGLERSSEFSAPFAIAVLHDPSRLSLVPQGDGLFCDSSRFFWAIDQSNEGSLVSFRKGSRLIVSYAELEDESNAVFQRVLDPTNVLEELTCKWFAQIISNELLGLVASKAEAQRFTDRLSYALKLVAETYKIMDRAPRLGQGGLFLLHVSFAFETLKRVVDTVADKQKIISTAADLVMPSFSLPNPLNGEWFDIAGGHEVAKTIVDNWGSELKISGSIARVKLRRNVAAHPNPVPIMTLESWNWDKFDDVRDVIAHENQFLAWHLHKKDDARRVDAFQSDAAVDGLTESEFFDPIPQASSIDGIWEDGRPLVDRKSFGENVVIPSVLFDSNEKHFVSPPFILYVPTIPGSELSDAQISTVGIKFKHKKAPFVFQVTGCVTNIDKERLELHGQIIAKLEVDGRTLEYLPELWEASVDAPMGLLQYILPTLPRRMLMLPLVGSGYLYGKSLKYFGPTQFDPDGSPMDQQIEYECELQVGERIPVIAWSGTVPSAVRIKDAVERVIDADINRDSIRWSDIVVAQNHDIEIIQEDV